MPSFDPTTEEVIIEVAKATDYSNRPVGLAIARSFTVPRTASTFR
jgi:hypothetical protein